VTIPVSQYRQSHDIPRYIVAVKNIVRRRKYREYRRYHALVPLGNEQLASLRCQNERNKVIHSKALCKQQSLSHRVILRSPSLGSIVIN